LLETWSSCDVGAGDEWRRRASDALESADLIVLLISADFLASDYLCGTELARAKERLDKEGVRLLSIRLRPADRGSIWPGALDVLPADGRAVTAWPDADTAWADFAVGIRKIVEEIADVLGAR
jgi:TIR domain